MKLFLKICFIITFITILSLIILYLRAQNGHFDKQLKTVITHYLKYKKLDIQIGNLHFANNLLQIDEAVMSLDKDSGIKIKDIKIRLNSDIIVRDFTSFISGDIDELSFIYKEQTIYKGRFASAYYFSIPKFTYAYKIVMPDFHDIINNQLGELICSYNLVTENSADILNCNIDIGKDSNFNFTGMVSADRVTGIIKVKNTPFLLYKFPAKLFPDNESLVYLQENVKAGSIMQGELHLDLDQEFFKTNIWTEKNIYGELKIAGLELDYYHPLPSLHKTDADISIHGSHISFNLTRSYISNTEILDGLVVIDFKDPNASEIKISATGNGDAKDLIGFIDTETLIEIAECGIDLMKITGQAITNINVIIPLSPGTENTYNITTDSGNTGLEIFDNKISLTKAKIEGLFDGKQVKLWGRGNINNFISDLNIEHDFAGAKTHTHIGIKSNIIAKKQKYDFLKLISGRAVLNFEYDKIEDQEPNINIASDLNNLEFLINNVFIHKLPKQKAQLQISSKDCTDYYLNLTGDNNLKILGNLGITDKNYNLEFTDISYGKTSISGVINYDKNNDIFKADIKGDMLDLSAANLADFMEKKEDKNTSDVSINIKKVKFKNNIFFNNVDFKINCDPIKCHYGHLNSYINKGHFNIHLNTHTSQEIWEIITNDTGSVLKALDIYTHMKNGFLHLVLDLNRKTVHKGQEVPIIAGDFTLSNFIIRDIPVLAKVITVMSLPGVASVITGGNDISFYLMKGKFSYNHDVLNINNMSAEGPYLNLTVKGNADTNKRVIKLTGNITPSFYGINSMLKNIPIISKFFPGRNKHGLISAPYAITEKY